MTTPKSFNIRATHSDITFEELEAIERTQKRIGVVPTELPIEAINVADKVFQWRLEDDNILADREHIKELVRVLKSQEEPLEPLLITPIGDKFYVIDGHHRHAAYLSMGWEKPIPVAVFDKPLKNAREEALRRNIRDKLPMTQEAKHEAAWRLNKLKTTEGGYAYSKKAIRELTTASDGTIGKMRRILEAHWDEVADKTWRQAKSLQWARQNDDFDPDDWKEGRAREIAEKIMSSIGTNFVSNPDILARALEIISPALPTALVHEWLPVAYEVVEGHKGELEDDGLDL
jgi:hypothetical protein